MNGNNRDDDLRFERLYELFGDEVNTIFDTKENSEIFTDKKNSNIPSEVAPNPTKITNIKGNDNAFNELVNPFDNTRGKEIKDKTKQSKSMSFEDDIDLDNDENKFISIISNSCFSIIIRRSMYCFSR